MASGAPMSEALVITLIGAFVPAVLAAVFAWWRTRRASQAVALAERVASEGQERIAQLENLQKFVDQLQEQLTAERLARQDDASRNRTEILELRSDVGMAMRGIRVRDDYIGVLRRYINDHHPPPPAYPAELAA